MGPCIERGHPVWYESDMAEAPPTPGRVPVSWGSPRFRTHHVGPLELTDAYFPSGASLPRHTHDRTVVAVTVEGAIESRLAGRVSLGQRDDVWTEPVGSPHSNRVGPNGARVLVIQPDPANEALAATCASLLDGVHAFRDGAVADLARQLLPELGGARPADELMIEGLALQIIAAGTRRVALVADPRPWLGRALQRIHDDFRRRLTVAQLAEEAGLHPSYFARSFKAETGVTVGRYVRRLRLEWAARELRQTDEPIGRIALRACFADQSHFTRAFRRYAGRTPARYRADFRG